MQTLCLTVVEIAIDACFFESILEGFYFWSSNCWVIVLAIDLWFYVFSWVFLRSEGNFDQSEFKEKILLEILLVEYCTSFVLLFENTDLWFLFDFTCFFSLRGKLFFSNLRKLWWFSANHQGIKLIRGMILMKPSYFEFGRLESFPLKSWLLIRNMSWQSLHNFSKYNYYVTLCSINNSKMLTFWIVIPQDSI